MNKGKAKEVEGTTRILASPDTGSANPASSLSALWNYMEPALNHLLKSSTNDPNKANSIDVAFYAGLHSACYNYITSSSQTEAAVSRKSESHPASGTDLYEMLDRYFADAAADILLGAPVDDSDLITYLVPCFQRYSAGARSINRLLNYVNRHYVKRAVDEDKGWLSITDVLEHVAKTMTTGDTREKLAQKLRDRRKEELKLWGYVEGGTAEQMAEAEASAEAASPPDRIIPLSSLAHRRFRIEVIDPLLAIPKGSGKKKKKNAKSGTGAPPLPKGRLARATKQLLESKDVSEEEKARLGLGLGKALALTGVRIDHPLRKRLAKLNVSSVA